VVASHILSAWANPQFLERFSTVCTELIWLTFLCTALIVDLLNRRAEIVTWIKYIGTYVLLASSLHRVNYISLSLTGTTKYHSTASNAELVSWIDSNVLCYVDG
jgi:hypothetical protein